MSELPPTEAVAVGTRGIDLLAVDELVATLTRAQRAAFRAVQRAGPEIGSAVEAIVRRLGAGGRMHYFGAGTSGRLAVLDAAECPPTFGTPPELVQAHVAGGAAALVRAVEGAEDDAAAGERTARDELRRADVAVGISASGRTPFVVAALEAARDLGALTVALTSHGDAPLARAAELVVVLETGAEPLAGSTRLVAGTAQKLVLNTLSTATMVLLGKVYDNLMVDVVPSNAKLRARAERLVRTLGGVDQACACALLAAAGGSVKVAVVAVRRGVDVEAARALLVANDGSLRRALGEA